MDVQLYIYVQCTKYSVPTLQWPPTMALWHCYLPCYTGVAISCIYYSEKSQKYFFLKLLLLRPNHEFKVFVCFGCFNFPSDCCKPCLWFSSAGVTVADETLSFAEYIFNYPNYQISRCQNKSKYCPPCPPLRGRLEREIEPKKYKLIHTAFSFTFLSVKRS